MATKRSKAVNDMLISAQKALADAKSRLNTADATRSKSDTLLHPDDILSGEVDAGRLWKYLTTRGGVEKRALTIDDLLEFKRTADRLKTRYKKGVKLRDVINLSLEEDVKRAREQITMFAPMTTRGGEIKFMTNASEKSDVQRHYVTVNLRNFEDAVVAALPPEEIVKKVIGGACAISCDCGRWRFWLAYLATNGGYNANPNHREAAYPKIRNPGLHGLACKHILRVATGLLQSPTLKQYVINLVKAESNKTQTKLKREALADMRKLTAEIAKEKSDKSRIRTKSQRQAHPSYQRQQAERKARADMERAAAEKDTAQKSKNVELQVKQMMQLMNFTEAQARAAVAAANNVK